MMARIRTVKPEFWSSEQVMSCSPLARLLFIGIWNFCDDGGNHPLSPRTIKALVFPGDDITTESVDRLLCELAGANLITSYHTEGKTYLHVQGWKHQKIDKRTFKYPAFIASPDENSASSRRVLDEESSNGSRGLTPGREGIGKGEDQHNTLSASFENSAEPTAEDSSVVHLEAIDPKSPCEMTLAWMPDHKLLKAYALRMAIPVDRFTDEATAAFVCHYSASGRLETQAAWVSLLVKWVKRDEASASNVRQFPVKRQANGPDFYSQDWRSDTSDDL